MNLITESFIPKAVTASELKAATLSDPELKQVMRSLSTNDWKWHGASEYFPHRDTFCVDDGLLLKHQQVVIPKSLRHRVLLSAHVGHLGISKMKERLRSKVWWPGMSMQSEKLVSRCFSCNITSVKPSPPHLRGTYLSLGACRELGIVHDSFPEPVPTPTAPPATAAIRSLDQSGETGIEADIVCSRVTVPHTHPLAT
jgi:hypothetical protein